jgi:dihydrofolate synthase/folylpolyglutamate synthase
MSQGNLPLGAWLVHLEGLSSHEIVMGLDRVREVMQRMAIRCPERVIHVAGTNGKGSSVAMLRSLFQQCPVVVGTYTSPHIIDYNERIAVDGTPATDEQIVAAFERVEAARGDVPLTYFEFGTLAALAVFEAEQVDIAVLEIGMGGRLDAVNAVEPSAGLITNVSLDHCEWLGEDIEAIAFEKAGIMRPGVPIVFADREMPGTIGRHAAHTGAELIRAGLDYDWSRAEDGSWSWRGRQHEFSRLAAPAMPGPMQVQNAAGVLALAEALEQNHLLDPGTIDAAFGAIELPGRMQALSDGNEWLFDVAHNPAAAAALASAIGTDRPVAIVGILDDKDVEAIAESLAGSVDGWIAVTARSPRAIDAAELARRIANATGEPCLVADDIEAAIVAAREFAGPGGPVLVTGSFYVVGPFLERLRVRGRSGKTN